MLNLDLTVEQSFTMRRYEMEVKTLDSEQAKELLLQALRMVMVKDNVIKQLMKDAGGV